MEGGDYASAVLLHGGLYSAGRDDAQPWGTGRPPERVVDLGDLSSIRLQAGEYAPAGWNGRLLLTLLMRNTGAHSRGKVTLRADHEQDVARDMP